MAFNEFMELIDMPPEFTRVSFEELEQSLQDRVELMRGLVQELVG